MKFPKPAPRKRLEKALRRTPLRAGKGLISRSRVKPVSERRVVDNRVYLERSRAYLAGRGRCERCNRSDRALELHHRAGRDGHRFLDVSTWCALCRECHAWVHANPGESIDEGWLLSDLSVRK